MLGPPMTLAELIAGLRTLNAPNQGMSYHSGGFRRGQPTYNAYTGERLTLRYDPAELNVYSDRAKFLHRLIENGEHLAALLSSEAPSPTTKAKPRSSQAATPASQGPGLNSKDQAQ